MIWLFTCGISVAILACAGATTYPSEYWLPHHAGWDNILRASVHDERVNYTLLGEKFSTELDKYLDELAEKRVEHFGREDQLAYYINLYNATMVKAVLDRYRPGWSPSHDDYAVFKEPLVRLRNERVSLNDLEHKIIRPQFKDPRVHAALVCAARSCPPLLGRAYRGEDLDRVLDENMKRFVLDRTRNPIDDEKKELKLSKIFDWYADDFGGKEKLAAYVGKVAEQDYSGYTVSFVEYSWELNDVRK